MRIKLEEPLYVRAVFVDGHRYPVREKAGIYKAHLFGRNGWTEVWADSARTLVNRIRRALAAAPMIMVSR